MSVNQARQSLNRLNSEIVALEKKSSMLGKKEATARGKAASVLKNIPKNASPAALRSKQDQIDRHNNEAIKSASAKADIDKKIADKKNKQAAAVTRLQKEEANEKKKNDKAQKVIHQKYEERIEELTRQLSLSDFTSSHSDQKHMYGESGEEEYDVFISHASEDKESIAEPLWNALQERGINVWYDSLSIAWGDSLRAKIDNGLRKSQFGIVILSKDYIKKGWTQYELDGLFQIEMTNGKIILPIWHNISKDEVQTFSPTLAGRKALTTSLLSATEIADELVKLLPSVIKVEKVNETEDTPDSL